MDLQLEGKRAIVTGASRGIGLAVTMALAAEGVAVAMVARTRSTLDQAVAAVGGQAIGITADMNDDAAVRAMVAEAIERLGGVDILVNNAARSGRSIPTSRVIDVGDDVMRDEFETKVLGYLRCARAVAPHMIEQRWGRIINIAGLSARLTGNLAGSVRNASVVSMTKNLADDLGQFGINVTGIHPGFIVTEKVAETRARMAAEQGVTEDEIERNFVKQTSIGRRLTSAELADVVTFLASPRSIGLCGDTIPVAGGRKGTVYY